MSSGWFSPFEPAWTTVWLNQWFYCHSTRILLMILLPFYWSFYSHSTGDFNPCCCWFYFHCTWFLLMILLPFYSHCTDDSTPILRIILFYWSTWWSQSFQLIVYLFSWWFYPHSIDSSAPISLIILLIILLPLYWAFYFHSTGDSTASRMGVESSVDWE